MFDLRCGDGRVVIAMGKKGIRSMGVDNSTKNVEDCTESAKIAGLSEQCSFMKGISDHLSNTADNSQEIYLNLRFLIM